MEWHDTAPFVDVAHRRRYLEYMTHAEAHTENQEWSAMMYVLSAIDKPAVLDCIATDDADDTYMDWAALRSLSGGWSAGERAMVRLARALLHNVSHPQTGNWQHDRSQADEALAERERGERFTLSDLGWLDAQWFEVALVAIRRLNGRSMNSPVELRRVVE